MRSPLEKGILDLMDHAQLHPMHWRVWLLASLGLCLGAFHIVLLNQELPAIGDRFAIGEISAGMIASGFVVGAMAGSLIGGRLLDRFGRRFLLVGGISGFALFGIVAALSWDPTFLAAAFALQGLCHGVEYPIAACYIAEFSPARVRGRMLMGGFGFLALGLLLASTLALAMLLLTSGHHSWRVIAAASAIPAIAIAFLRRSMPESPRWYLEHGHSKKAAQLVARLLPGQKGAVHDLILKDSPSPCEQTSYELPIARLAILTTASWFLVNLARATAISASDLSPELHVAAECVGILGILLGVLLVERIGRLPLQLAGYSGMFALLLLAGWLAGSYGPPAAAVIVTCVVLYKLSVYLGPSTTSFTLAAELMPTRLRGSLVGLAAACGNAGFALRFVITPYLEESAEADILTYLIAGVCFVGIVVTLLIGRETRGLTLENIAGRDTTATGREEMRQRKN